MFSLLDLYTNQFLIFVLVLTRLSGVIMLVPALAGRGAPIQIRALLAIGISLIITPIYADTPIANPSNLLNMTVMVGREATLGLALGLAIFILFSGIQLTGQLISQLSGLSIADVYDPNFDSSVSAFTQVIDW